MRFTFLKNRSLWLLIALPILPLIGWSALHRIPGLAPFCADFARFVLGTDRVARLEERAYDVEDKVKQLRHAGEAPKAYWEVPSASPAASSPSVSSASPSVENPPTAAFRMTAVGPVHSAWAAPGDGEWVPVLDARHGDDGPRIYKTLLHPDRTRSWTAVSVVAIDLKTTELHVVAGRHEPVASEKEAATYERKGLVPEEVQGDLVAVFNGGFKAEHGHYGFKVDNVLIVRSRPKSCTISASSDGSVEIAPWEHFAENASSIPWFRQAPACMVENGELHQGLRVDTNTAWGCTLDGKTVIRRSAVGLDESRSTLFVGIGDDTTARAIALAMQHAGAKAVAQLDVNYSYPKFVTFEAKDGKLISKAACPGFEVHEDDYVRRRSPRDFFYLTRKSAALGSKS